MPVLSSHFVYSRPVQHRVTVLETEDDVLDVTRITDNFPDSKGLFRRQLEDYGRDDIPLLGAYFIEELDEDVDATGRFEVLTEGEFRGQLTEYREPVTEYGIQRLARSEEVAPQPSVERCREVMDFLPVLTFSGEYAIVKRQGPSEPGPWEPLGAGE